MKAMRIKDNSQTKKSQFFEAASIIHKIADKTFEQLEREGLLIFPSHIKDSEDIQKDQFVLQSVNDYFQSGNAMGFLGCGKERLVIESRFSEGHSDYFLQYLLSKVLDFPNVFDMGINADNENNLFNMFVLLFPYYLQTAIRKGPFKTYIRSNYNNGNVKGAIDVARHIKHNIPFAGNIAYTQREYSYDNELMQLVRHTVEYIKKKSYGANLLSRVKEEVGLVVEVTPKYEQLDRRKIISINKRNPLRHAYYREYRALQRLCLLILQNQKHQVGKGARQIYGILFDGAWLWEEYINTLVKDYFHHPMNKSGKGAQRLFGGNKGLIYPDFLGCDKDKRIIADAKYKPTDNIANKDYLQVLAYMFRFDAKTGYYFYPDNKNEEDLRLWLNRGSTYEGNVEQRDDICVIKHGLKIPKDADCYKSFAKKMQEGEKEFMKVLPGI